MVEDTALYYWHDHPGMKPLPRAHFVDYWSTMPRPSKRADAERAFVRFVRDGQLLRSEPWLA